MRIPISFWSISASFLSKAGLCQNVDAVRTNLQ